MIEESWRQILDWIPSLFLYSHLWILLFLGAALIALFVKDATRDLTPDGPGTFRILVVKGLGGAFLLVMAALAFKGYPL